MVGHPISSVVVRPIHVAVGPGVPVVGAVNVAAWNVMVLVNGAVRQNAIAGKFPLAEKERFGGIGRVDGPNVARVVGVGAVFGSDHGQVSPVDAENGVVWPGPALGVPGLNGVDLCGTVAQEVVVRNGVMNPAVAVEGAGATSPFFRRHVRMATTVGAVPSVIRTGATKPSTDFVVLRPRDAFGVGYGRWIGHVDDAETCVPIRDVEQGLSGDGVNMEHVVVVEQ